MKTIYSFPIFLLLAACATENHDSDSEILPQAMEVCHIYPQESIVLIEEGYVDTVLLSDYLFAVDDQVYFNEKGVEDVAASHAVKLLEVKDLSAYPLWPDFEDWFKKGDPELVKEGLIIKSNPFDSNVVITPYKLWWKAECNQNMRGFTSPCIGTFGRHKWFGNSMQWTINPYKTCGAGRFFCLEKKQKVGTLFYHRSINCRDSIPWKVDIEKFSCP